MNIRYFVLLSLCCIFASISYAAVIEFVLIEECSTPTGCDFNNPAIWNTSTVPSVYDDVFISSNKSFFITLNHTDISISSLHISDNGGQQEQQTSTQVSQILLLSNATLNITEVSSVNSLEWMNANDGFKLELDGSTLNVPGLAEGNNLLTFNSNLNIEHFILNGNASEIAASNCTGNTWDFEDGIVFVEGSFVSVYSLAVDGDLLYAEDTIISVHDITANFYNQINGSLTVQYTFYYQNIYLVDTTAYISYLEQGDKFMYDVSFPFSASLYFGIGLGLQNIVLGDNVAANIMGGQINMLVVGDNVTLNVMGITDVSGIQQNSIVNPTKINLKAALNLYNSSICAEVAILAGGSLGVKGAVEINGTGIHGGGSVVFGDILVNNASLIVSNLAAPVVFMNNASLTVGSKLNTSFSGDGSYFVGTLVQLNVSAQGTIDVAPAGISLTDSASLHFAGSLSQTNGKIKVAWFDLYMPLITVDGSVSLSSVSIEATLPSSLHKLGIIQSTNDVIVEKDSKYVNSVPASGDVRLRKSRNEIYLERLNPNTGQQFFAHHAVAVAIGGAIALAILSLLIYIIYSKSTRTKYTQIN